MGINQILFEKINSLAGSHFLLDKLMVFSAVWLIYVMVAILIFLILINLKKHKDMFLVAVGSALVSRFFFTSLIRYFYHHLRPEFVLTNVHLIIPRETEFSFPSGHAAFTFALATGVYFYDKKLSLVFFILALLMGFSRIYVGVHWPFDIIGGAVLGIVVGIIGFKVFKWLKPKIKFLN